MIEDTQDEDVTPELVDLDASFCTILGKDNLVASTDDAGNRVIDMAKGALKQNISNILAVSITLSLFQDEFTVNYSECHIPRPMVFTLACRLKDGPNKRASREVVA